MNRKEIEARCQGRESRTVVAELRAGSGDEFAITGYATLYNNLSHNLGGFRESIKPGAFTRSLREGADVKCLFNHVPDHVLGRTKSGTLTLTDTPRGLQFRCVLDPQNTEHSNLYRAIKRGDIDECSFAFTVTKAGQQWAEGKDPETGEDILMRTLTDVLLLDVSAVTYPAYPNTSVGARAEARKKPDYGTNPADEAFAVITLRKSARSIANVRKTSPYPAPYDYDALCKQYDEAMVNAETACSRSETTDDTFDAWDETDERSAAKINHAAARAAHAEAHAALVEACNKMAAARMAMARCSK